MAAQSLTAGPPAPPMSAPQPPIESPTQAPGSLELAWRVLFASEQRKGYAETRGSAIASRTMAARTGDAIPRGSLTARFSSLPLQAMAPPGSSDPRNLMCRSAGAASYMPLDGGGAIIDGEAVFGHTVQGAMIVGSSASAPSRRPVAQAYVSTNSEDDFSNTISVNGRGFAPGAVLRQAGGPSQGAAVPGVQPASVLMSAWLGPEACGAADTGSMPPQVVQWKPPWKSSMLPQSLQPVSAASAMQQQLAGGLRLSSTAGANDFDMRLQPDVLRLLREEAARAAASVLPRSAGRSSASAAAVNGFVQTQPVAASSSVQAPLNHLFCAVSLARQHQQPAPTRVLIEEPLSPGLTSIPAPGTAPAVPALQTSAQFSQSATVPGVASALVVSPARHRQPVSSAPKPARTGSTLRAEKSGQASSSAASTASTSASTATSSSSSSKASTESSSGGAVSSSSAAMRRSKSMPASEKRASGAQGVESEAPSRSVEKAASQKTGKRTSPSMPKSTAATAAGAGAVAAKKRSKSSSKKLVLPFAYAEDDPRVYHAETCEGRIAPEFLPPF
eukprot:TRINITY_DN100726_c0_g1_i1.p1 TRINITY_DN100726_c0_g1~~TRINITY_DN100726_c0_g1_i1.p1  ORF type:complete len:560 (+),score=126.14 TRINITY_DN100726_c0_g1_i1:96-1775(+)